MACAELLDAEWSTCHSCVVLQLKQGEPRAAAAILLKELQRDPDAWSTLQSYLACFSPADPVPLSLTYHVGDCSTRQLGC